MPTRSNSRGPLTEGEGRVQGDQEEVECRQDRARRQEGQGGVPRPDRGAEGVDFCQLSVLHLGLGLLK